MTTDSVSSKDRMSDAVTETTVDDVSMEASESESVIVLNASVAEVSVTERLEESAAGTEAVSSPVSPMLTFEESLEVR